MVKKCFIANFCSIKLDSILDVLIQLKVSTPQTVGVKTKSDVVSAATK